MKRTKSILLGSMIALSLMPAQAQEKVQRMNVKFTDGTTQQFKTNEIKEVTFEAEAQEEAEIVAKADSVYPYFFHVSYEPADPEATYIMNYLEKSEFDVYASDEEVVAEDLLYYKELAQGYELELSDVLYYYLAKGNYGEWTIDEVKPNTDYVVWYYGLTDDGKQTTPFYKTVVHTPAVKTQEGTFTLSSEVSGNTLTMTITPDDENRRYVGNYVVPVSQVSDVKELPNLMQSRLQSRIADYVYGGYYFEESLGYTTFNGTKKVAFQNMEADTEYYMAAAYVDDEGSIVSTPVYIVGKADSSSSSAVKKAIELQPAKKKYSVNRHIRNKIPLSKR